MDSRRTPQRIRAAHLPNQIPQVPPNRGPTPSASTLPSPVEPEAPAVPPHNGLGPHYVQGTPPILPKSRQHDPEHPVNLRQPRPRLTCFPHGELLPQREILQRQFAARANRGAECPKQDPKPSDHDRSITDQPPKSQDNRDGRLFRKDRVRTPPLVSEFLIGLLHCGTRGRLETGPKCEGRVKTRFFQKLMTLGADTRCAADLLRYFSRHPSLYVTTAQLASSVGHSQGDVEATISTLTQAGLIVQRRHQRLTAALYHLVAEEWLSELVQAASTVRGRRQLRRVLRSHELCRRAAATNARAIARLDRSARLLTTIRPAPRAGS